MLGQIVGAVEGEINDLIADIAKELHIHDFYSVHLLDYCEVSRYLAILKLRRPAINQCLQGFYTPSPVANNTVHPTKNITHCSNRTSSFHFNATNVIQTELKSNISLPDLSWPSALQDGIGMAKHATRVMFVLYCLGVAATGLALGGVLFGMVVVGRLNAIFNVLLTMVNFEESNLFRTSRLTYS